MNKMYTSSNLNCRRNKEKGNSVMPKKKYIGKLICAFVASAVLVLGGCGGGGDSANGGLATGDSNSQGSAPAQSGTLPTIAGDIPSGPNVLQVSVDTLRNAAMATITLCVPGTAICKTIDRMQIDTGSVGVRVNASALAGMQLPAVLNDGGYPAAECMNFLTVNVWGAVRSADVSLAGETARSLPIQVISDPAIPSGAASGCSALRELPGENGVIGIGYRQQDCGFTCTATTNRYYSCPPGKSACGQYKMTLDKQVSNPVTAFASNNNGVIFQLPAIPESGASSLTGAVIFGIGTQGNNTPSGLTVLPVTAQTGAITAWIHGVAYNQSLVDSGTQSIMFNDSTIPTCANGRFCPVTTVTRSVTLQGATGSPSKTFTFPVVNAASQPMGAAANNVAESFASTDKAILGLPFFYGKTIAFGMSGANTSIGVGPYVAL